MEKLPLLALAAATCVINFLSAEKMVATHTHVSMPARLGNAVVSYVVYLRQMVWPKGLAVLYPFPQNGPPAWEVALSGALLAGLSVMAWKERRTRPWLPVGWFWYLGMLTPMIGIVQVGTFAHADRFTYLPQIGVGVALTWLAAEWRVSRVIFGGAVAVLMVCAWQQTAYWQNTETLWNRALACTADNAVAHNNLGNDLYQKGKVDEAIPQFQMALQIRPNYPDALNNLGFAFLRMGRLDEAIPQYEKALQLKPDDAQAHNSLGIALCQKGNVDEGINQFEKALQIRPGYPEADNNLRKALLQKQRAGETITR